MILLMNFVKIRIPQYVQFSLIFVYPKYRLMTCNTFSKILHVRYRIIISTLLFSHEKISSWSELFFLIIFAPHIFTKYYQNAMLVPLGENYELGLSNLTHLYTPIAQTSYMLFSTWCYGLGSYGYTYTQVNDI